MLEAMPEHALTTGDPARPALGMGRRTPRPAAGHPDHGGRGRGSRSMAGKIVYKLRDILLLMAVAGFIALLLNPLGRPAATDRGLDVGAIAVTIVTVFAVLVFAGLAYSFGAPLANGLTPPHLQAPELRAAAPSTARGTSAIWCASTTCSTGSQQNLPKFQGYAKNLSKPALKLGAGAFTVGFDVFVVFILVLLLLLEGPKLRVGVLRLLAPERAASVTRIAGEVNRSVTGFMLGNFITSIIAGVVVFVTLVALGVPYALLWALWVALFDFLPHGRRGAGRYPHRPVRADPLAQRRHRLRRGLPGLHPDREPRPQPHRHEQDGAHQPARWCSSPSWWGPTSATSSAGSSVGSWARCWPSPSPGRSRWWCARCGTRPLPRHSWRSWEPPGGPTTVP